MKMKTRKGKKYTDFIFVQVVRLHKNKPHFCAVFVQNENEQTCFDEKRGGISMKLEPEREF